MEEWLSNLLDVFMASNEEITTNLRMNSTNPRIINDIFSSSYTFLDLVLDSNLTNVNTDADVNRHESIIHNAQIIRRMLLSGSESQRTQRRSPTIRYDVFVDNLIDLFRDQVDDDFEFDDVKVTLTDEEFDDLRVIHTNDDVNDKTCSICLEECEPNNGIIKELKCKHVFHEVCIKPWLTEQSTKCCVCRVDQRK